MCTSGAPAPPPPRARCQHMHAAPQLRTAGRDEQTSCKSRRADTRPAACEQRLLQLRCRWASASTVGQLASAAQPAVGAASTAADPIDFKLNCFPSSLSELCPKRKKQRKRPLRAELPPVVITTVIVHNVRCLSPIGVITNGHIHIS